MAFDRSNKKGLKEVRRTRISINKSKKLGMDTEPKGKLKVKA